MNCKPHVKAPLILAVTLLVTGCQEWIMRPFLSSPDKDKAPKQEQTNNPAHSSNR